MGNIKQKIPAELESAVVGGYVTDASQIIDRNKSKSQAEVNQEVAGEISDIRGGSTKSIADVSGEVIVEKERAKGVESGLDNRLGVVEQLAEISIGGGDAQIATGTDFDDPTAEQRAKIPTVEAVLDGISDGVFDLTAKTGDTYADLQAALTAANTAIPTNKKKGGMSIKFIQSSDNEYVQYRLMADCWSTDTEYWAIVDEGVYVENPEYVYVKTDNEGKILWAIKTDGDIYYGAGVPQQVINYIEGKIAELSLDEYEDIVAFLNGLEEGDKTLQTLLNEKVDKEEGKSLIDSEYASIKSNIENPEFLEVTTDSEDKILEGIQQDGTKVIGGDLSVGGSANINGDAKIFGNMEVSGVSYKVIESSEFLAVWLDAENKVVFGLKTDGKTYVGDADFLNEIKKNQDAISEINSTIASIIDSLDSLDSLDIDALLSITVAENNEYIEAKTDSEGKLLAGRTTDGAAFENVGFSAPKVSIYGHTIENIKDIEGRTEITTDSEGKILSYRDSEGVIHENVGINTPVVNIPNDIRFDIISLYPEEKMIPILKNLTFVRHEADGHWDDFDGHRINHQPYFPLILLHFTDIHEDSYNLSRIYKFYQKYKEYIDDVVFTGDVVLDVFDPSKSLPYWKNGNADEFLFVVGNHDACSSLSPFTPVSPREEYNTYIEPFLSKTNINSVDGKCYWYKDYPNAKSPECPNGIRLIAVDQYHWYEREVIGEYVNPIYSDGTAVDTGQQEAWLNNLLGSARENGLAVIMALHSPVNGEDTIDIDCTFNTLTEKGAQAAYSNIPVTMLNDIQNFINAGGEFICWMAGHMHQDWFVRIKDFPDQIIMLANTGSSEMRDRSAYLLKDTMYADNFNIFSIDPFKKFIRLHRIGLNFDVHGRHIENLVYDYKNKVIVYNN